MSARAALTAAVFAAREYEYIPDAIVVDGVAVPTDIWDTPVEFEKRGGGDCDGFTSWAIHRAWTDTPGDYFFVAGLVHVWNRAERRYEWGGHAWVEVEEGGRWGADPTWGWTTRSLADMGIPGSRLPRVQWRYNGVTGLFDHQEAVSA